MAKLRRPPLVLFIGGPMNGKRQFMYIDSNTHTVRDAAGAEHAYRMAIVPDDNYIALYAPLAHVSVMDSLISGYAGTGIENGHLDNITMPLHNLTQIILDVAIQLKDLVEHADSVEACKDAAMTVGATVAVVSTMMCDISRYVASLAQHQPNTKITDG